MDIESGDYSLTDTLHYNDYSWNNTNKNGHHFVALEPFFHSEQIQQQLN